MSWTGADAGAGAARAIREATGLAPLPVLRQLAVDLPRAYLLAPMLVALLPNRNYHWPGLVDTPLGQLPARIRLRSGYTLVCRWHELVGVFDVFAVREYAAAEPYLERAGWIIDIGANVGAATLYFAGYAPNAHIVAVEPAIGPCDRLRRNVQRNHLEDRVSVVRAALADRSGTRYLESGRISVAAVTHLEPGSGREEVPAISLEDLLSSAGAHEIDVLKIDCEGAEYEGLLSVQPPVLRRCGMIVGELHQHPHYQPERLLHHLSSAGFEVQAERRWNQVHFSAVRQGPTL